MEIEEVWLRTWLLKAMDRRYFTVRDIWPKVSSEKKTNQGCSSYFSGSSEINLSNAPAKNATSGLEQVCHFRLDDPVNNRSSVFAPPATRTNQDQSIERSKRTQMKQTRHFCCGRQRWRLRN
jgi:hypothetical protein